MYMYTVSFDHKPHTKEKDYYYYGLFIKTNVDCACKFDLVLYLTIKVINLLKCLPLSKAISITCIWHQGLLAGA